MPQFVSRKLAPPAFVPLICVLACAFPGSLLAAPHSAMPPKKAASHAAPANSSGAGIVVCEPVGSGPDADFGAGCALWLQMEVGGQGALGKTPSWDGLNRARTEMGRTDLRLSAAEAALLARMLGATHAAVGTLSGTGPRLTLTYKIIQVPAGTPVGAALTISGTREQIMAGLPKMAKALAMRLGTAFPNIPASVGLSPHELKLLASERRTALTDAQEAVLSALAVRNPLAGMIVLVRRPDRTRAQVADAVRTLLSQAPANPLVWELVWEVVGSTNKEALVPQAARLDSLVLRFPHNHLLAEAQVFHASATGSRKAEMAAASRMVTDAPRDPKDWLTYAMALSDQADDIRYGRAFDAMTPAETDTLGHLYPRWQAADVRATVLDPAYAYAWVLLSHAATFSGDSAVADKALDTAWNLSRATHAPPGDAPAVITWALQMYQPKWGGNPVRLAEFARIASEQDGRDDQTVLKLAHTLGTLTKAVGVENIDGPALKKKLLDAFVVRKRAAIAAYPDDGRSHLVLGDALAAQEDVSGAISEYRTACNLLPGSAVARYDLARQLRYQLDTLGRPGTYDEAIARLQEAVKIDPNYQQAYLELGYCLEKTDRSAEASQLLKQALRVDPEAGPTYGSLAQVQMQQKDYAEAIINYRKALSLGDYRERYYENLITALNSTGQLDAVLETAQAGLLRFPQGNSFTYNGVANVYLQKKLWDQAITASQAALALDSADPWAHENLAEAYLGAGRLAEARTEWQTVVSLKNDDLKTIAQGYLKKYP